MNKDIPKAQVLAREIGNLCFPMDSQHALFMAHGGEQKIAQLITAYVEDITAWNFNMGEAPKDDSLLVYDEYEGAHVAFYGKTSVYGDEGWCYGECDIAEYNIYNTLDDVYAWQYLPHPPKKGEK